MWGGADGVSYSYQVICSEQRQAEDSPASPLSPLFEQMNPFMFLILPKRMEHCFCMPDITHCMSYSKNILDLCSGVLNLIIDQFTGYPNWDFS